MGYWEIVKGSRWWKLLVERSLRWGWPWRQGPPMNHLVCSAKEHRFHSGTGMFLSKESHQAGILECYSWEWWDVSDEMKEVELIVFGAKERRVSWSQTWAAGWMVEIFTETLNTEGGAGLGERGGWWMYLVWGFSRTSRWRCLYDYGWNSVQRSRLGREIEELVV